MQIGPGVVGGDGNRRLEFGLSLGQPGLHLAENPERKMSRRPVRSIPIINGLQQ
jgi:hypothetical protein